MLTQYDFKNITKVLRETLVSILFNDIENILIIKQKKGEDYFLHISDYNRELLISRLEDILKWVKEGSNPKQD